MPDTSLPTSFSVPAFGGGLIAELSSLPPESRDRRIVDLCDSAINNLNDARTLEEVFGIRDTAEAFGVYTRKWKAAAEAQNSTALVVLLAEARIGAELKAAQARGEIASAGDKPNVRASDNKIVTLPSINIPRQRAAEFKALSEVGNDFIRGEVAAATAENRRPSRAAILKKKPRSNTAKLVKALPSVAMRPSDLTQFVLWLRAGAALVNQLSDPEATAVRLAKHGMFVTAEHVEAIHDFITSFREKI